MKRINPLMTLCFVMVFLLMAAASCKKGDTGPAGPAGPAGPTGATGATGAKGDTGTANVIYSPWLDVAFTRADTSSPYIGTIAAPKLDANMLAKGEIKVYANLNYVSAPIVYPLPYFDGAYIINVAFQVGTITMVSNDNFSTGTDATGKYQQYRYILIPGGKAARSSINWNDYAEVKKYLNLKD